MITAYTRKSTDKQDLENQIHRIKTYAYDNDLKIDNWYEIELSSRKSDAERQIDKLVDSLNNGDTLIVTELNRLGRKMLDLLVLIKTLNNKGVKVLFTNDEILNPTGNAALDDFKIALVGFLAEDERQRVSDRTKRSLKRLKDSGASLGHNKKFLKNKYDGYSDEICELRLNGMSFQKICNMLDKDKSKKFTKTTMCTWFNKRYTIKDNTIVLNSDFEQHLLEAAAKV